MSTSQVQENLVASSVVEKRDSDAENQAATRRFESMVTNLGKSRIAIRSQYLKSYLDLDERI